MPADRAYELLAPLKVSDDIKAQVWDDFSQAKDKGELKSRLDQRQIPNDIKAQLWDDWKPVATAEPPGFASTFWENSIVNPKNIIPFAKGLITPPIVSKYDTPPEASEGLAKEKAAGGRDAYRKTNPIKPDVKAGVEGFQASLPPPNVEAGYLASQAANVGILGAATHGLIKGVGAASEKVSALKKAKAPTPTPAPPPETGFTLPNLRQPLGGSSARVEPPVRPQPVSAKDSGAGFTQAPSKAPPRPPQRALPAAPGTAVAPSSYEANPGASFTTGEPEAAERQRQIAGGVTQPPPGTEPARIAASAGEGGAVTPVPSGGPVVSAKPIEVKQPGTALARQYEANPAQGFTMGAEDSARTPPGKSRTPPNKLAGKVEEPGFKTDSGIQGTPAPKPAAPKQIAEAPAPAEKVEGSPPAEPPLPAAAAEEAPPAVEEQVEAPATPVEEPKAADGKPIWKRGDPVPRYEDVVNINPHDLVPDPERFQYKQEAIGKGGTTDEFRDVTEWNPGLGGAMAVWQDPETGLVHPINGHHRTEMAQRINPAHVNVRFIEAATAEEARTQGALLNIGEDKGTAVDAAKLFRDAGMKPEDLVKYKIKPTSKFAVQGMALSKLDPSIFRLVVDQKMTVTRGALIGDLLSDPVEQKAAVDFFKHADRNGKRYTNEEAHDIIRAIKDTPEIEIEEGDPNQAKLFGPDRVRKKLFGERAEVSAQIGRRLAKEKDLFSLVAKNKNAERLGNAGNILNAEENRKISQEAAQVQAVYDKLKFSSGPVADALNQAAKEVSEGVDIDAAADRAYAKINKAVADLLGGGKSKPAAAERAGGNEAPSAPVSGEKHSKGAGSGVGDKQVKPEK